MTHHGLSSTRFHPIVSSFYHIEPKRIQTDLEVEFKGCVIRSEET